MAEVKGLESLVVGKRGTRAGAGQLKRGDAGRRAHVACCQSRRDDKR